jgi:Ohr subfamily peroxiredoxin
MGGSGEGTNPEELFAVGYAACFESAIKAVARREKLDADEVGIDARVDFGSAEHRSFTIAVGLDVTLPGFDDDRAAEIVRAAHKVCPYSNATRGNIDVALTANGRPVEG